MLASTVPRRSKANCLGARGWGVMWWGRGGIPSTPARSRIGFLGSPLAGRLPATAARYLCLLRNMRLAPGRRVLLRAQALATRSGQVRGFSAVPGVL